MRLIQLDENNKVIATWDSPPAGMALTASHMFAPDNVNVGWTFVPEFGSFQPAPPARLISKLAFDNRFTANELVRIKLAQIYPARLADETEADYLTRCTPAAQLRMLVDKRAMATFIDLDRADTRQGVLLLASLGLLQAAPNDSTYATRADEILDTPVADAERYRGGERPPE